MELEADGLGAEYLQPARLRPAGNDRRRAAAQEPGDCSRSRRRARRNASRTSITASSRRHPDNDTRLKEVDRIGRQGRRAHEQRSRQPRRLSAAHQRDCRSVRAARRASCAATVSTTPTWASRSRSRRAGWSRTCRTSWSASRRRRTRCCRSTTMAPPQGVEPKEFLTRIARAARAPSKAEPIEVNGLHGYTAIVHEVSLPFGNRGPARYAVIYCNNLAYVFVGATRIARRAAGQRPADAVEHQDVPPAQGARIPDRGARPHPRRSGRRAQTRDRGPGGEIADAEVRRASSCGS